MFFNISQIRISLSKLRNVNPFCTAFLAFKKAEIPIGSTEQVVFTRIVEEILQTYYRPVISFSGFYSPFKTSNPQDRWNDERYSSTTVQRIVADTFKDVFIHRKGSQLWGWRKDYIDILLEEHLSSGLIPAFDLAVWLFQNDDWYEGVSRESVIERFFLEFKIRPEERRLFDTNIVNEFDFGDWLQPSRLTTNELLDIIGDPPNSPLEESAILESLKLAFVGPVDALDFNPAPRLNLVTGDNGLGKTFLLECILNGKGFVPVGILPSPCSCVVG